ncbi:MAG: CDP-glucose 4,6-dehydratase [Promethearchaeota archaeon]
MEHESSILEGLEMINYFGDTFNDKKILITGHTGFIGSWLSILCLELGAQVIGYALKPLTINDNFVVTNLSKKIINIYGDIRNYKKIKKIVEKYKPEIIFHLAAQPIVRESYVYPKETYDINVGGTVNIFECFRKNEDCKLLINFTTDKVYENIELEVGYKEDDRLGGHDPYSSSKACSELITSAYKKSFFENESGSMKTVSTVRCGNIIGGGDWQKDRLIPDCMRALKQEKNILIRNPNSIRPWQFILEPLRGLLLLTKKMLEKGLEFSGAWNFGPNPEEKFTVKEIVNKIITFYGKEHVKIITPLNIRNEFHETKRLLLNNTKAKHQLGWKPILDIDDTIKYVCDWYREERVDYDFDVNQINDYFKKISK